MPDAKINVQEALFGGREGPGLDVSPQLQLHLILGKETLSVCACGTPMHISPRPTCARCLNAISSQ
jgi:hypothetical protein